MPKTFGRRRPSAPLVLSSIALFVSLGGVGYAATGGNFILGVPNTATSTTLLTAPVAGSSALRVVNNDPAAGSTPLALEGAAGHAPFTVNSETKVTNLNADKVDGVTSAAFLRRGQPMSFAVDAATGAAGVVDVTNTGTGSFTTNGVQGRTQGPSASGVYGEHIGPGGFGVAARAGNGGNAIYGDNTGTGYAGFFEDKVHVGGDLEVGGNLSCTGCVPGSTVSGKVGDADNLDGLDSTAFMRGGGNADGQAIAQGPGANNFLGPAFGGLVRLQYQCPSPVGGNGALRIVNASGGIANFFVDSGGANPDYFQLGAGGFTVYPASAAGDSFSIQAQGAPGVATIEVGTVHRSSSNDCHAQALGVLAG